MTDLTDWVFVYEGGSVFLGKLYKAASVMTEHRDQRFTHTAAFCYLEPVYLYVMLSRPAVNERGQILMGPTGPVMESVRGSGRCSASTKSGTRTSIPSYDPSRCTCSPRPTSASSRSSSSSMRRTCAPPTPVS